MPFESLHNFYETLVMKSIKDFSLYADELQDADFLEDVACVALNRLPPKYVRYDVDLVFYMTGQEREQIESSVDAAVKYAIDYVRQHRRNSDEMSNKTGTS